MYMRIINSIIYIIGLLFKALGTFEMSKFCYILYISSQKLFYSLVQIFREKNPTTFKFF